MTSLRPRDYVDTCFAPIFPARFWIACGISKSSGTAELQSSLCCTEGYLRPPLWKRLLRKLRAESKHLRVTCCHWCPHQTVSHQYTALSYQKNFDQEQSYRHHMQLASKTILFSGENSDSEDLPRNLPSSVSGPGFKRYPKYELERENSPFKQRERPLLAEKRVHFAE